MITRPIACGLAAIALFAGACTGSSDDPKAEASASPSATPSGPQRPTFVVLKDGSTFGTLNIKRGILNPFREIELGQITISPDGRTIIYVVDAEPQDAKGTQLGAPILRIGALRTSGADDITIGPGIEPLFSPDGTQVAAVLSDSNSTCDPEGCSNETVVIYQAVAEPNDGEVVLEEGSWDLVGWTGSQVLAVSESDGSLWLAGPEGSGQISSDGTNVLAVSPTESRALIAIRNQVAFLPLPADSEEEITGEVIEIALDDTAPSAGFWSPDGSKVVVLTDGGAHLIDAAAEAPSSEEIPDSAGATGTVLWAADSAHFMYQRDGGRNTQALLCDPALDCELVFSWEEGEEGDLLGLTTVAR